MVVLIILQRHEVAHAPLGHQGFSPNMVRNSTVPGRTSLDMSFSAYAALANPSCNIEKHGRKCFEWQQPSGQGNEPDDSKIAKTR